MAENMAHTAGLTFAGLEDGAAVPASVRADRSFRAAFVNKITIEVPPKHCHLFIQETRARPEA